MFKIKFARILGSIAAASLILSLAACGGGSSSHNFLSVSGPAITTQPVGPEISSGQTATLTVVASGSGTLSYQWYQGPTGITTNAISGATSSSYTTPMLTATTSYWVQVSDSAGSSSSNTAVVLIAGPRQVQALMYSSVTASNTVTVAIPGDFLDSVLPNISGVAVSLSWSEVESTNSAGTGSGGYDFTSFDASLQQFYAKGRAVNLIVWPATEGGNNDPSNKGATPAYVLSAGYAASLNTTPQDMAVCPSYTGDSSNPFYSATQSGGTPNGGSWNVSSNIAGASDLSGLPVSYEVPFMTAYQAFIVQVIKHYNGNAATPIGYIRFGFSQGGENSPECNQYWPNFSQTAYLNYISAMTTFVKQQNPTMTILEDLHSLGNLSNESASVYVAYPDQEAQFATTNSFGFGTNGLQASDLTAGTEPCDSDWCALFTPAGGFSYNPTLSLQTLQWTDPTGSDPSNPTGSLTTLEPFAKAHAANNLELYQADVGIAFDTANYQSYPHALPTINAASYSNGYAGAITDFLSH
jgi:Ig-like domain CHU_C associated